MNIAWDANGYTKDFAFVHQYGEGVMDLLTLEPGSTILDLGCGNGALTKKLSEKGYRATGLDNSQELLAIAQTNYPKISFTYGDARDFALDTPVDGIFSNAVLHWIDEADQLDALNCISKALRPGGQFIFEFGGFGCCATIHNALAQAFEKRGYTYHDPKYYPTIGQYSQKMESAGLRPTDAFLFNRWTPLNGDDGVYDWISMFVKIPFEQMPAEVAEEIRREAADSTREALYDEESKTWYADYVRIRMRAIKVD